MQVSGVNFLGNQQSPGQGDSRKLERAAIDFESLLIAQMLKSVPESSSSQADDGEHDESNASLMELSEQQFAQSIAAAGGLGIAKMVVAGLPHADR